ncbi:MAG: hypothetical protein ONB46_17725 [candidate division KSB1 bacterium]|nr:hypothetical protein [candidate division KSB1 bacterium]MDZ7367641.1 hypothetical protein [candidate division KSB1 bacterium]MDZ7404843.1 hypothetical protein [candidate division KSB1 bacterium]
MSDNCGAVMLGALLIAVGAIFLAVNLLGIGWRTLWPMLLFAGSAVFFVIFLTDRRNVGLLMPATILLVYGALFQYCTLTGWWRMSELWPLFIFGPGLGFFMMYLFGHRESGLLIPACILICLSVVFFFAFGPFRYYSRYWPVLLIIAGLFLLLRRKKLPAHPNQIQ